MTLIVFTHLTMVQIIFLVERESSTNVSFETNCEIISANFLIKRNRTWSKNIQYTYVDPTVNSTVSVLEEQSGTWHFIKEGNNDYKKKERVLFSTDMASTEFTMDGTVIETSEVIYSDGQNVEIYTVIKSKKRALELDFESNSSFGSSLDPQQKRTLRRFYSLKQ